MNAYKIFILFLLSSFSCKESPQKPLLEKQQDLPSEDKKDEHQKEEKTADIPQQQITHYQVETEIAKYAFILVGKNANTEENPYIEISNYYSAQGIQPIRLKVEQPHDLNLYLSQVRQKILDTKIQDKEVYFFGFSLGALAVAVCAPEFNPKGIILASPAIYFSENRDMRNRSIGWEYIALSYSIPYQNHEFMPSLVESTKKLAELKLPYVTLAGGSEFYLNISNAKDLAKTDWGTYKEVINGDHNLDIEYLRMIKQVIETY